MDRPMRYAVHAVPITKEDAYSRGFVPSCKHGERNSPGYIYNDKGTIKWMPASVFEAQFTCIARDDEDKLTYEDVTARMPATLEIHRDDIILYRAWYKGKVFEACFAKDDVKEYSKEFLDNLAWRYIYDDINEWIK